MSLRDVKTHNAITTNKTNIKIPSKNVINTLYVIQYKITIHATWWKGLKKGGGGPTSGIMFWARNTRYYNKISIVIYYDIRMIC